jgi:hypothetical protein
MLRSELVKLLNEMPDVMVGDEDANMVLSVQETYYNNANGMHPYIALELEE